MMSIDKNKVLSNDNLLGLRGGVQEDVWCCMWIVGPPDEQVGPPGLSGTGSCDYIPLPAGMYAKECDPPA